MPSNKSAFIDGKGKPLHITESTIPEPGPEDIIVESRAFTINTIDPAQQDLGFQIASYPAVVGIDLAGEVYTVDSNVTRFKKGERIVGHAWSFLTGKPEDGAFQLYSRIPAKNAATLPEKIEYKNGVVLPLAIDTASCGLHQATHINLDWPTLDAEPKDKALVVYGGSSSVGLAATQLAANAGYQVVSTASPKNFDLCKRAGATAVIDYRDSNLADKIAEAVGKNEFVGLYNAIGVPETWEVVTPIVGRLGGGIVANTKPPPEGLPETVKARFCLGIGEFSFPLWEKWVGPALEAGKLKCLPEPMVVGKGLESLEEAFEVRRGDVHAQKIVVEV